MHKDTQYWLDRCIKTAKWRLENKKPYRHHNTNKPYGTYDWCPLDEERWQATLDQLNKMTCHVVLPTQKQPFDCRRWCNQHAKGEWLRQCRKCDLESVYVYFFADPSIGVLFKLLFG